MEASSESHVVVCSCGWDSLLEYTYENRFYGLVCPKCWRELLPEDMTEGAARQRPLIQRQVSVPEFRRAFPVNPSRKEVTKEDLQSLSPGDHVMWRRPYVMWHHAIVIKAAAEGTDAFTVIHWSTFQGAIQIHEKEVSFSEERGKLYLATYREKINKKNPSGLVLARAFTLNGSTDYQFFSKNCENFAIFCKTGVNFNHQFPWLMLKLDETATGTLARLTKAATVLPTVSTVLFAETVEFSWEPKQELIGACFVILLELISLIIDLGNMYFEYKYPTSYCRLERQDYKVSVVMRVFEFLVGAPAMIGGAIAIERLCIFLGDKLCPGFGTLVGFGLGILVFGVLGGFILGTIGKALGNALGLCIGRRCTCCRGPPAGEVNCNELNDEFEDALLDDPAQQARIRKLKKVYRPSSWIAQLGIAVIIISCVLLYAFSDQYMTTFRDFRGSVQATCVTQSATYLSKGFPCIAIQVRVVESQLNISHSTRQTSRETTQLFENENALYLRKCSYLPFCRKNDTKTWKEVHEYEKKFGIVDTNYTCYHQANNQSQVIRKVKSISDFVHMFLWPSLSLCLGIILIINAVVRHKKPGENCFITLTVVLGLRSYFDLFERCRCCCC